MPLSPYQKRKIKEKKAAEAKKAADKLDIKAILQGGAKAAGVDASKPAGVIGGGVVPKPTNTAGALTNADADKFGKGNLEDIANINIDLNADYSDVPGGISGVIRAREEMLRRETLDNKARLEASQAAAIASGKSEEDIIRTTQELIRKVEKDESVRQQQDAAELAQRTLIREQQALARAGKELDIQGSELMRQSRLLEQSLLEQTAQLDFTESELGKQSTALAREAASTRRQGALAARSAQATVAQAANLSAQSGLRNSALRGASAAAQSEASTKAGDILTGLFDIGQRQDSLAGKMDLLGIERKGVNLRGAEAKKGIIDARTRLGMAREQLASATEDVNLERQRISDDLAANLSFIQETYTLGGDINRFATQLAREQAAAGERAQQRADLITGITSGATVGANFGIYGAIGGGIVGGALTLL